MSSLEMNERALVATMSASGRCAVQRSALLSSSSWKHLSRARTGADSQYAGGINDVDRVARANENESELIAARAMCQ